MALVSKVLGLTGVTILLGTVSYGAWAISGLGSASEAAAMKAFAVGLAFSTAGADVVVLGHAPHSKLEVNDVRWTPVAQFPLADFLVTAKQVPATLLKNRVDVDSKVKAYLETQEGFNFLNAKGVRREEALLAWFKYTVDFDKAVIAQLEANKAELLHLKSLAN